MHAYSPSADHADREDSARPRHISVREALARHGGKFPFTVAAPSFVLPAGAAENSRFLAPYFDEIGLLFFETEACLAYTDIDLPPDLADLPVSWHVHLPLDLPWQRGLDEVWAKLALLLGKAAHLSPHAWVLHPPTRSGLLAPLAEKFRQAGVDPASVLLENVEESDLCALWDEAREGGYSTCLDLGHILAYNQQAVLDLPGLRETVRMLHVYAPDGARHTGLGNLDGAGKALLRDMLATFCHETLTLEIFNEHELFESIELLAAWTAQWSGNK